MLRGSSLSRGASGSNLEKRLGFRSTQRLWISDVPDGVLVATWPAELARQARYLYGGGLGSALVAAAIERGWTVEPRPTLRTPHRRQADGCICVRRSRGLTT